jgi:hypothetical protein
MWDDAENVNKLFSVGRNPTVLKGVKQDIR